MEFDYAIEKGKRAVVLVHSNLASLPIGKSEPDPIARQKLDDFIKRATDGRLMKTWSNADDLAGKVSVSLQKTIKTYPAIGWVRADKITNNEVLSDLMDLTKENESLKKALSEVRQQSGFHYSGEIAGLDSTFELHYSIFPTNDFYGEEKKHTATVTWKYLFHFLSPYIHKHVNTSDLYEKLKQKIDREQNVDNESYVSIDESDLLTIEIQFVALGLIKIEDDKWKLTPKGVEKMFELRIVK